MTAVPSPGRRFYDRQIDLLQRRDVETLIAEHYQEDAVLIATDRVVAGAPALRAYFATYRCAGAGSSTISPG